MIFLYFDSNRATQFTKLSFQNQLLLLQLPYPTLFRRK